MCGSKPKASAPPVQEIKPPAPLPRPLDEGVVASGQKERKTAQARAGLMSTVRTSQRGILTPPSLQKKTLLGA